MSELLSKAENAIFAGDKATAQKLLVQLLNMEPENEAGWTWMAAVVDDPQIRKECLEKVLQINPKNERVAKLLAQMGVPSMGVPSMGVPSIVVAPSAPPELEETREAPPDFTASPFLPDEDFRTVPEDRSIFLGEAASPVAEADAAIKEEPAVRPQEVAPTPSFNPALEFETAENAPLDSRPAVKMENLKGLASWQIITLAALGMALLVILILGGIYILSTF